MKYTTLSPSNPWLGKVTHQTLIDAVYCKIAWQEYQKAYAIILDSNGYIISNHEQNIEILKQRSK